MGLIKALTQSVSGVFADQWKEYFYCDALDADTLAVRAKKRTSGRSSNTKGSDNIISNGSCIAVADGQCMLIVDQGKVAELCAVPGEYIYDSSSEPSIFTGSLGQSLADTFVAMGRRFTFGGEPARDQRVYYINTKELTGCKYGTPNPVPFRVVDQNIGLDIDISIRCFGEYSYRIADPILFYQNVCGNITGDFTRDRIDSQLKSELLTALQPGFAKVSAMGVRYSALPGHAAELADAMNQVLSEKWRALRGIEVVSMGVSSVTANPDDEAMIKELQRTAVMRNPNMAAAHLVTAQADAMKAAAANESTGPALAFMGMNMAAQAGGANANQLFSMGAQAAPAAPTAAGWTCACGTQATGNFCPECGSPRKSGWVCACGTENKGKFCTNCGAKKPAGVPKYRCDKCGWEPEDPTKPPRFCPECGDPFNDSDIQ